MLISLKFYNTKCHIVWWKKLKVNNKAEAFEYISKYMSYPNRLLNMYVLKEE